MTLLNALRKKNIQGFDDDEVYLKKRMRLRLNTTRGQLNFRLTSVEVTSSDVEEIIEVVRQSSEPVLEEKQWILRKYVEPFILQIMLPLVSGAVHITMAKADMKTLPWNNIVSLMSQKTPFTAGAKDLKFSNGKTGALETAESLNGSDLLALV